MNSGWTKSSFAGAALTVATLLAIGLCQPGQANAAMVLRLTQGATVVTIVDGGAGDGALATPGWITFSGAVGTFNLNLTGGLSKPQIGNDPTFAHMDLSSQSTSTVAGGTLTIELTDTDFPAFSEPAGVFYATVGGTNGGTSAFDAWKSTTNQEFAANGLHIELPTDGGVFGPGGFTDTDFLFHGPIPTFSMTLVAVITHTGLQVSSFDVEVINSTPERIPGLPEPTSMAIWGLGAGALGLVGFRRRKRAAV